MAVFSAIFPIVFIVVLFFFIVRIATVILKLTGLDAKTARFQAISAFTGTGFTTKESEIMLEDEIRRKTAIVLMVLGKVGIVSVIASFVLSFGKDTFMNDFNKAVFLSVLLLIFYKITTLKRFSFWLNKFIEKRVIAKGIMKQKTLEELFRLPKGYGIAQLHISSESEEQGQTLAGAGFINKDILVLSIERKNKLVPFPRADDIIKDGDTLLCYGLLKNVESYA